ncbi:lysosomal acid phosphatase [Trichonephila clavipes]|nr:lysosomal acid phosphatase [Trichonephila clavipes]
MACQVTRSFANRACLRRAGKATAAVPRYRRINCADAKTIAGSFTGGRLQHYALGVHLQDRYKDFITTNPREIEMINSNNYRCQFGVYSFIAGLYSPTKEYSFTDEIRWQPIISRQANFQGKVGYS